MVVSEMPKTYIFPRVPLKLTLPDNYPEIDLIASISVFPEIKDFRFLREELEIEGSYLVSVSYFKASPQTGVQSAKTGTLPGDDFFGSLKLQADGLFADDAEEYLTGTTKTCPELYTVEFSRPLHTFIDLELISHPRTYKPGLVIEKVDLEASGARSFRGELVLGLINKARRNYW